MRMKSVGHLNFRTSHSSPFLNSLHPSRTHINLKLGKDEIDKGGEERGGERERRRRQRMKVYYKW